MKTVEPPIASCTRGNERVTTGESTGVDIAGYQRLGSTTSLHCLDASTCLDLILYLNISLLILSVIFSENVQPSCYAVLLV